MKIILAIFFLFFFNLKSSATEVKIEDMSPSYWEKSTWIPAPADQIKAHKDLVFEKPIVYNNDARWVNQIFLPNDKPGPFPVIVIMPDCGSVGSHNLDFMQKAFQRGYAAIVLDTHRGFKINCGSTREKPVNWLRLTKDAYDIAAFLSTLPNINKNRIYSIGGSEGGMVGGFLSSPGIKSLVAPNSPIRFRASSSLYGCAIFPIGIDKNINRNLTYIFNDMDRPLLWLIGEADTECLPAADIGIIKDFQERKLPIEYHVYKDAYHCWDCMSKSNLNKTLYYYGKAVSVSYRYDEIVTNDSIKRSLDFFDKHK